MGKRYGHTQSYSEPNKRKRGGKMGKNGLQGRDYALIVLAIIAVVLMFVLFVKADQVWSGLPEAVIFTSPGQRPTLPPPTPTPAFVEYLPLSARDYVAPTSGPSPTPAPTPTFTPTPVCTEPGLELEFTPNSFSLGNGEWVAQVYFDCVRAVYGPCYYYVDGEYIGTDHVYTTLSCSEAWGPYQYGVAQHCPGGGWVWDYAIWRILPPVPCP